MPLLDRHATILPTNLILICLSDEAHMQLFIVSIKSSHVSGFPKIPMTSKGKLVAENTL